MDSKILQELINLKDKCNDIKNILSEDITSISKQISEKVDLNTYEYTAEENNVVTEIEDIMNYIENTINEFYKYEDEGDKNNEIEGEI